MTIAIATASRRFCVMVSDRIITLSQQGKPIGTHDRQSNKSIVFIGADVVAVFAYTGVAYVDNITTDQWIAQEIWGEPIAENDQGFIPMVGGKRPGASDLNQILLSLRKNLRLIPGGAATEIAVVGYRYRRERFRPFLIAFDGASQPDENFRSPLMRIRRPTDNFGSEGIIGYTPTQAIINEARLEVQIPQQLDELQQAAYVAEVHAVTIRKVAKQTATVGSDVMKVMIPTSHHTTKGRGPWQRKIICQFDSVIDENHNGYCPWVVTDFGFQPASVTGALGVVRDFRGWKVELSQARLGGSQAPQRLMAQSRPGKPG